MKIYLVTIDFRCHYHHSQQRQPNTHHQYLQQILTTTSITVPPPPHERSVARSCKQWQPPLKPLNIGQLPPKLSDSITSMTTSTSSTNLDQHSGIILFQMHKKSSQTPVAADCLLGNIASEDAYAGTTTIATTCTKTHHHHDIHIKYKLTPPPLPIHHTTPHHTTNSQIRTTSRYIRTTATI